MSAPVVVALVAPVVVAPAREPLAAIARDTGLPLAVGPHGEQVVGPFVSLFEAETVAAAVGGVVKRRDPLIPAPLPSLPAAVLALDPDGLVAVAGWTCPGHPELWRVDYALPDQPEVVESRMGWAGDGRAVVLGTEGFPRDGYNRSVGLLVELGPVVRAARVVEAGHGMGAKVERIQVGAVGPTGFVVQDEVPGVELAPPNLVGVRRGEGLAFRRVAVLPPSAP